MTAKRVKLIRNLRILECSLVDRGANEGARILLWKRHEPDDHHDDHEEDEPMPETPSYGREDVAEAMLAHAACKYPAPTREASLALALKADDPMVHRLYRRHCELPADVVTKNVGVGVEQTAGDAALQQTPDMDAAWASIVEVAHGYMERDLRMTEPQAIALACERRGDLYHAYTAAQSEASFELNQRSGTRREL